MKKADQRVHREATEFAVLFAREIGDRVVENVASRFPWMTPEQRNRTVHLTLCAIGMQAERVCQPPLGVMKVVEALALFKGYGLAEAEGE